MFDSSPTNKSTGFEQYNPTSEIGKELPTIVEKLKLSEDVYSFCLRLTPYKVNTRILFSKSSYEAAVIDPGGEGQKILEALNLLGAKKVSVWLTHSHPDHCGAVWLIKDKTGASIYGSGHEAERYMRSSVERFVADAKLQIPSMRNCPEVDKALLDGEILNLGNLNFTVIETPGHSPGHLCFYSEEAKTLLSGDLVFARALAPTDIRGADPQLFMRTLKMLKERLPADTKSLAGHGRSILLGNWTF